MSKYKDEDGFWRIGCTEITEDVGKWVDAKRILGEHLQKFLTSYHWMSFGWLDEEQDFVSLECSYVEIT